MDFTIKFTPNALEHLRVFKKFAQKVIGEAIKDQLKNEPLAETRNRKVLHPNPLLVGSYESESFEYFMMWLRKAKWCR